jgi:uncharacterized protein (UPF0335 family)
MTVLDATKVKPGLVSGRAIQTHEIKSIIERVETREKGRKEITDKYFQVVQGSQGQRLRRQGAPHHRQLRKMDAGKRQEAETILETYMQALGML